MATYRAAACSGQTCWVPWGKRDHHDAPRTKVSSRSPSFNSGTTRSLRAFFSREKFIDRWDGEKKAKESLCGATSVTELNVSYIQNRVGTLKAGKTHVWRSCEAFSCLRRLRFERSIGGGFFIVSLEPSSVSFVSRSPTRNSQGHRESWMERKERTECFLAFVSAFGFGRSNPLHDILPQYISNLSLELILLFVSFRIDDGSRSNGIISHFQSES